MNAFGMEMSQGMNQSMIHKLDHEQKMALKQLLELRLALVHPEIPQSARGLAGMLEAHQLLIERGYHGLLIGGLSEEVWGRNRTEEDLFKHKDVDVLVLNDSPNIKRFERGVDWWLPYDKSMTYRTSAASLTENLKWWQNGNGVILNFGVANLTDYEPGLYIHNPDWVIEMRIAETLAGVASTVAYDSEVIEKFENQLKNKVKTRLPKIIVDPFKGRVLHTEYGGKSWDAQILKYRPEQLIAIKNQK